METDLFWEAWSKSYSLTARTSHVTLNYKYLRETMKHLKSSLHDLRQVFDRSVSVRYIAEPFVSFDDQRSALEVSAFMEAKDFDLVGVRQNGTVVGYACRADLQDGMLEQYMRRFDNQLLLDDWSSMLTALQLLAKFTHVFVVMMGEVVGIIMKGDLQKAPVRMWLFGVISLLEMQFLRLIHAVYPEDTWKGLLSGCRLAKAEQLFQERQLRNEAIDLVDCLQFADKRTIILKSDVLRHDLGFSSKRKGEEFLKELEHLRDELAHAQDIITGHWPHLVKVVQEAEQFLAVCERLGSELELPKNHG
jgi:predicted transcriptional regulator